MKRLLPKLLTLAAVLFTLQASAAMYIVGSDPFGGFYPDGGVQMTDNGDGTYSYSARITGTVWFFFADGQTSDWSTFNSQYRIGPTEGDETVTYGEWVTTQYSGGDHGAYRFTGNGSDVEYVITFDKTNMKFKISGGSYYGFESGGFYFNITSSNQVTLTHSFKYSSDYSGDVVIPSTVNHKGVTYQVTTIGEDAFYDCTGMTSVWIPTTVKRIEAAAFYYCTALTSVVIPESVYYIGDWNFYASEQLTMAFLPSTLSYMGIECFSDCDNLIDVTCKATTPPSISSNCFYYSTSRVLHVPESAISDYQANENWSFEFKTIVAMTDYDFAYNNLKFDITGGNTAKVVGHVISSPSDAYSIPNVAKGYKVTEIGREAFFQCEGITSMSIGTNVEYIGPYAFYLCKGLTSVDLRNVKTIDDAAFGDCFSLIMVTIPSSVTHIGDYGFGGCGLATIFIPATVQHIGDRAFYGCSALTAINVASANPNYRSVNGVLFNKSLTELMAYPIGKSATSYTVPESVTRIRQGAFGNSKLISVTLPAGLTDVEYLAFADNPSLTYVTCLATTPPALGAFAFVSTINNSGITLTVPYNSHESYRSSGWRPFAYTVSVEDIEPTQAGDVNNDNNVSIADVTALIDVLLSGGAAPATADVNGDNNVSIADVTALIDLLLSGETGSNVGSAKSNYLINSVPFTMVKVDGGTFMMGLAGDNLATPIHQVTLSDYSIGQTEVTQALWQTVMGSNPSSNKSNENLPVENMDWNACQQFVSKLSQITRQNFRLPTEAEWEFAARGGNKSQGYTYAGSNNLDEVGWYKDNSGNSTHVVATKAPNELGLYDMSGNVFEWCQDYWGSYTSEAQVNPQGPTSGEYRACRSSAYCRYNNNNWFKCGGRTYDVPTSATFDTGLRLGL